MNGWHNGVYIHVASDQYDADASWNAKRWDRQMIVEVATIQLVPKVLKFEVRSCLVLNFLDRKKSAVESLHSSAGPE
jgi:hypothetical protein